MESRFIWFDMEDGKEKAAMVRFGIIGTGKISHTFMKAALKVPGFRLEAVYSRSEERGRAFVQTYGAGKAYTSLEELGDDKEVDAVYIASPNSTHCHQTVLMLNHGKHVLCEKPIASSSQELARMTEAAEANDRLLLEAMRSVFDPGFARIRELLPRIGKVRRAAFQYCQYSSRYDAFKNGIVENAFNPALSNAALMDIGVYCIHPMVALFGKPEKVTASSIFLCNHMEGAGTVLMDYGDMIGEARYSKITDSRQPSEIQGEDGSMLIWQIPDTRKIQLIFQNGSQETYEIPKEDNNMYYEILRFVELIEMGQGERPAEEYLKASILEMEVMDQVRQLTGIRFDGVDAGRSMDPV